MFPEISVLIHHHFSSFENSMLRQLGNLLSYLRTMTLFALPISRYRQRRVYPAAAIDNAIEDFGTHFSLKIRFATPEAPKPP